MNSDFFKKEYRDAYQRFFSKNATVISLPFLINWSGDVFSNYQGFRIKQKIPFRSYIGVTRTKEPKISFDTITYFDFGEERFLTSNLLEYAPIFFEYENYFNKEYQAEIQKNGGIKIQIFSELSRGVGLGFVSVITLLFLLVLERIYGNLPIDQMKQLSELPPSEVLQAKTILNKLLSRTLEINRDLDRHISPEVQISAFFHSYYPIVSFTEDIPEHTEDINNVHMYGYRLNDIDPELPAIPYIPIDYGILYSGRPVLVDHIINTNDASFEWTEKIKDKLHKAFSKDVESLLPAQKPRFYKTFIEPEENVIKKAY